MNKTIKKPWGHEIIWAQTQDYVGKILYIKADHRLSKQYHQEKEETVYVLEGVLYNYDENDNPTMYGPGNSLHIKPNQVHRFGAKKGDVKLVEVSTNYLSDVVRLEDDYKRK